MSYINNFKLFKSTWKLDFTEFFYYLKVIRDSSIYEVVANLLNARLKDSK